MNVKVSPASPSSLARALLTALGVLLLLCGLFLAVGGGYLLTLGGSPYFVAMGAALIVSGVLVARRMRAGAWLYALASISTVVWAVDEVGLEFWPLVSRLFAFGVLALLVSLAYPALVRASGRVPSHKASGGLTLALLAVLAVSFALMFAPKSVVTNPNVASVKPVLPGSEQQNWEHWGNTTTGTRFAALDQITRANVGELQVAWTAHTGDIPASNGSGAEDQNTPLQIGDSLYVCTAYGKVLSLDVDTGAQRWMFDPKGSAPNWQRCRGLGYFDASAAPPPAAAPASALPAPAAASTPALVAASTAPASDAASSVATPAGNGASGAPVVSTIASASVASEEASASSPAASPAGPAGPAASAAPVTTTTASAASPTTTTTASTDAAACIRRLFLPTIDARLIAVDADTGRPCAGFGTDGVVDLKVGMGEVKPGYYQQTSTPLVAGEVVIVGGRVADNFSTGEPPGVVRAYDVRTGALAWAWDPGNPDITRLPPEGQTYTRGTPNVWSAMSYDPKLGLVYLPTGNATPDFFGGQRTALDDQYNSSVVAVDVKTGRVRWSYQTTHHDLWDFDLPAQPLLYDLPDGKGGTLPALVQITKQGMIFVLDRVTGKPLAEVQEREVPQGHVPGERYSPTQPYSVGMPSIGNQTLIESDMWGGTPFDQLLCRIAFKKMRHDGVYTPPGLDPALQFPGSLGGMNWGSVSVDASNDVMFVNDMRLGLANYMIPRQEIPAGASGIEMGVVPQEGTPFGARRDRFLSQLGIPCQAPPYGTMSAIDLRTRKLLWQVPVGTVQDTGPLGIRMHLPIPIGMPTLGASLATQSGLLFFAGTQDFYLRAFDSGTGREIWKARLPVGSQSGPMTYVSPKTGKQYVVISAGGARQSSDRGDYVIAYALPK